MHAGILDVDVAAQSGVEEQIPAWVMVVVVDVNLIAVPVPIPAAIQVVRSHDPIGIIVENHAARVEVLAASDEDFLHMLVAAVGIRVTGLDAGVFGVPMLVMRIVGIIPAFVFAVVVAITFVALVLFLALVLAIVVAIIAVLRGAARASVPASAMKIIPAKNLRMIVLPEVRSRPEFAGMS